MHLLIVRNNIVICSGDTSTMAVSLSTNVIKLYAPATGQYLGDCLGHSNTISEIHFPDSSSPTLFCSSSADGTVRTWDIRVRKEVLFLHFFSPRHQTIWDFLLEFGPI